MYGVLHFIVQNRPLKGVGHSYDGLHINKGVLIRVGLHIEGLLIRVGLHSKGLLIRVRLHIKGVLIRVGLHIKSYLISTSTSKGLLTIMGGPLY